MKNMEGTDKSIDYYNDNATQYFNNTVDVDMSECCDRFLKYVVPHGRIIDIGAGSGRDIKYFKDRGYVVEGIDASAKMCRLATEYSGTEVICEKIQTWQPQGKYDGIWASASLLHLSFVEIEEFICRVPDRLRPDGAFYFSMKSGIRTGLDNNSRFLIDFSAERAQQIVKKIAALTIADSWETMDRLSREEFRWINLILKRC